MRPADQHLRGAEWSHPGHLQQPRSDRTDEHGELGLGLVGLRGQELDALGSARSAWMVARCSSDLVGRARRLAQQAIWRAVLRPPSSARRSSGVNGPARQAAQPAARALSTAWRGSRPLIAMIGISRVAAAALRRRVTSQVSSRAAPTSITIASGRRTTAQAMASSPSVATWTS